MSETDRKALEQYVMNLLARGAYTRLELEHKLARRSDDEPLISEILDVFEEAGYIDDALYARLYVESHDSWSRRRLVDELCRRGILPGRARDTVDESVSEEAEYERALELGREWSERGVTSHRVAGRLSRRGFPHHLVVQVLEDLEG